MCAWRGGSFRTTIAAAAAAGCLATAAAGRLATVAFDT